jgi:flagellar biosynthesis chaperone FliJ
MPTFQFRLQVLLDRRLDQKKQAEENLAARKRELTDEQRALRELEDEADRLQRLYEGKRADRVTAESRQASELVRRNEYLSRLKSDVQAARSDVLSQQVFVDEAQDAVHQAQELLTECRRQVEVLEKYREKTEKRFLQELAYKEELEQDEIGNVMHLSRQTKK